MIHTRVNPVRRLHGYKSTDFLLRRITLVASARQEPAKLALDLAVYAVRVEFLQYGIATLSSCAFWYGSDKYLV